MNINKIKISGTTYNIQDENACNVVELTQAQYDALPATAKTSNSLFVITDATGADLSNYYTKSETSGATQISTALASKQTTLTAGTNITIVDNVISATGGGGGGKAVSGGTNISITTGETADTINCTIPVSADTNYPYGVITNFANNASHMSFAGGYGTKAKKSYSFAFGLGAETNYHYSTAIGEYTKTTCWGETAFGSYNKSVSASTSFDGDSGNTLFSVGNGTSDYARHNAFEIRQNGEIYIADTNDTSTANYYEKPMIKLQDALGGGSSYTAGDGIDITNDVISVTGKVDTSAITTSITSANTNTQVPSAKAVYDQLGGLKLVKLSQSAYDALSTKDSMTLYIIEEAPECNIPSTATWHDVDATFDRTTQIYGIDFSSGDGGNDGAGRDYSLEVKNANNTIYGITCHLKDRNAEMGDSDSIVISNADGTTYRQLDDTATINSFCEIFGEPMYISDSATIPSYEQCVDEQCTEYDCLQWDEETGECIEQGDCINSECMEYQTTYFITALY